MITLTVATTTLSLPDDLLWVDELAWSPVQQSVERSLTGALIVQQGLHQGGRPITLEPPAGALSSWISRADLEQLQAWAALPGLQLALLLRGASRTVIWRHHDGEVIDAEPVMHWSDVQASDAYAAKLKFMEI